MKFDKKVMESGVVAAFSLVLAFTAVPVAGVSTEADLDSRTVELTTEAARKYFGNETATKVKRQSNLVAAALEEKQPRADNLLNEAIEETAGKSGQEEAAEKLGAGVTEQKRAAEVLEAGTAEQKTAAEVLEAGTAEQKRTAEVLEAGAAEQKEAVEELDAGTAEQEEAAEEPEQKETTAQGQAAEEDNAAEEEAAKGNDNKNPEENKENTEASKEEEVSPWDEKLMPKVEEYLNVRTEASEESEPAGKLPKGSSAEIIENGAEWTKIKSGNVEGYVKNDFCVTGKDAETLANELGTTYATAVTGGVRVRETASSEEGVTILDVLEEGGKIKVDREAEAVDGWVCVKVGDTTGYVSADYVTVELELGKAISIEEERAAIEAAEAERKAKEAAQSQGGGTTQRAAVAASYDDVTLLGALIQCEAGSESYEGQLAVGAVVMNRLRAGYAGSISGVIYQSGQFTPASNGTMAGVLASGVSGSCLQAAQQAIGGADNVGGATSFRNVSSGIPGIVIGNHVFF